GSALGQGGRAAGEDGSDGGAEPQRRRPRAGQDQRRERVGAVHLRGPHVGVAEVGQLGEQVSLAGQGDAVDGHGDAVALHAMNLQGAVTVVTGGGRGAGRGLGGGGAGEGARAGGALWRGGCRRRARGGWSCPTWTGGRRRGWPPTWPARRRWAPRWT